METSKCVYVTLTVLGFALLGIFCLVEVVLSYPVAWWLYGIVSGLFGGAMWAALAGAWPKWTGVVPVLGTVVAWVVFVFPWSTRKPFLNDLRRVEIGMNEAEVREVMGGYIVGTGWPSPGPAEPVASGDLTDAGSGKRFATVESDGELELEGAIVFRHSDDGAFNSDWGIVEFEGGLVSGVEFSAD